MTSDLNAAQEDFVLELEMEEWRNKRDERRVENGEALCDCCGRWFKEEDMVKVKTTDDWRAIGVENVFVCWECKESMEDID
jgi:hypothetical protein